MGEHDKTAGKRKTISAIKMIGLSILLGALLAACATVPLTGRTQLNLVSDSQLMQMSLTNYDKILKESKLSRNQKQTAMVRRVGGRIARAAEEFLRENGLEAEIKNYQWEFNLIEDDKMVNAWCMPGGKVAVYTGLLPVAQNETGLAVVMGHEIAHAMARHGNERMSQSLLVALGGVALAVALHDQPAQTRNLYLAAYGAGATVGVMLPYSRHHETEADRIGLTIMAKAGYDPREAVPFWNRMNKAAGGKRPPEFLSTHPAPASRIQDIQRFLPEAMKHYRKAGYDLPAKNSIALIKRHFQIWAELN